MSGICVECDAELNLSGRARVGQRVVCPSCGVQLEVISAHPLEVDVAYDDGDEWDDMDGYGVDDELDDEDLDDIGRIEGVSLLDDDLDDFEDDLNDDFDDELDDELDDDLGDEFDDEPGQLAAKRSNGHP